MRRTAARSLCLIALLAWPTVAAAQRPAAPASDRLYLWASSTDSTAPDFLAVFDVKDDGTGDRYGGLVTTIPIPGGGHGTHHTEHEMPADRQLFASDHRSGENFIFDLSDPAAPRLARRFGDLGPFMHAHSFWRLPNGHVLATLQMQHDSLGTAPGGLVELTSEGRVVRSASADLPGVDRRVRPYSSAILPDIDRIVVTTTDMQNQDSTSVVQFWRLSDLSLRASIDPSEEGTYACGTERRVFTAGGMTFGIAICHEGWRYPETVRAAVRQGAQVVFHPHFHEAEPGSYRPTTFADPANTFHEKALLCRAAENTCYVASVNFASAGSPTTSAVVDPDGTVMAWHPYGEAGVLFVDLDLSRATRLLASRLRHV